MQSNKILLTGLLCALFFTTFSQSPSAGIISGIVTSADGTVIPGASVQADPGGSTQTGINGKYQFRQLKGTIRIRVSALGYRHAELVVRAENGREVIRDFALEPLVMEMEEVTVLGRTETQEVNRQAFNVTAVDAKALYNSTLDLSHALDRVSGVRVRETGGVGSNFSFSLNGFTGNRVKFFMDGVPMDNFGSSFQINNIPINLADRVEVYKGVVPIWLGSDALGGAVNIVTGNKLRNYVDVSYSYGSFNTHRTVINAATTSRNGLTLQLNAFQNYSDNNYWVTVNAADIKTGRYYPDTRLRRFHDQYHNETLIAKTGVVNKWYADRLLVGITLGRNYKEIQTGARMVSVFGGWHRRGNIVMPALNYQKKDLFVKGLEATVNANYNLGQEQNIDTVYARFGWRGDSIRFNGSGGERSRQIYTYRNNNGIAAATFNYLPGGSHSFTFNNVFSTFNRKGRNELNAGSDPDPVPRQTYKNVTGLAYKYDLDDRLSATVFAKYLYQFARTPSQTRDISTPGYGAAMSYFLLPGLQLKASYEKSNRLPESDQLFGDVENLEGNDNLKPESSDNVNVGASYSFSWQDHHHFIVSANAIYRYATDYIYLILNNNQSKYVPANLDGVSNIGGDGEVRYSFKQLFTAGANFTYQNLRNEQKYEHGYSGISPVYHDRMPNHPFMFGNADASFFFRNVGARGNTLSMGYNLLYVHAFYLYWPSRGGQSDKYDVPKQLAHDANIVYTFAGGRYNMALECKNLTDALVYDNFSLQKPSRGFYLKIRYFFNK